MNITPITIPAVEVRHPLTNAVLCTTKEQTVFALDIIINDDTQRKIVSVNLGPKLRARPLVLWTGAAYDAAGDYTQAQVEARVTELLGADPVAAIVALIKPPVRPVPKLKV